METLSKATGSFGSRLLNLLSSKTSENIFISPTSIMFALGMAYAGSQGETRKEMEKALQLSENSLSELAKLSQQVKNISENELNIANSVWVSKSVELQKDFQSKVSKLDALVQQCDFKTQGGETVKQINKFVADATKNMIPSIMDNVAADTIWILVNAVSFKGKWAQQFSPDMTQKSPFHKLDGSQIMVDIMHLKTNVHFHESQDFKLLELPYLGEELSMFVALPNNNGEKDLARLSSPEILDGILANPRQGMESKRKVDVFLPKFKFDAGYHLNGFLAQLGLSRTLSKQGEFGGVATKPVYIDEVIHKSFVEVDEEGTKAAAATAIKARALAIVQNPTFNADHPFLFFIYHHGSKQPLFIGRVTDPSKSSTGELSATQS
jgi:serine protease inhibitor